MDITQFRTELEKIAERYTFERLGVLAASGKLYSIPRESSFVAKLVEDDILVFLADALGKINLEVNFGGERAYPDVELYDPSSDQYFAVDIKCGSTTSRTNRFSSRPTLYTFGTYLSNRETKASGILRPYNDYSVHLDVMTIYEVSERGNALYAEDVFSLTTAELRELAAQNSLFTRFDVCVVESWRVASHLKSSGTRQYVGSVSNIKQFTSEEGVFQSEESFLAFWDQLPYNAREIQNLIFGNSRQGIPSSHCTVDEFAELMNIPITQLVRRIEEDDSFPVFSPDSSSYELSSQALPGRLLYPYIAAKYLGSSDLDGIEARLFELRKRRSEQGGINTLW
jgi:hypothetical protein